MPKKINETFLNNYNNLIKSTESIQTANGFLLTTHLFLWWQWQSSPLPCHGQTSSQPKQHSCHRCQPRRVSARHRRWVSSGPLSTIPGSVLWNAGPRPLVGLRAHLWTLLRCRKCMACLQSKFKCKENLWWCVFHTNTQYSTVQKNCISHCIWTHLQYKLHPGLKRLWISLRILLHYVTLDREGWRENDQKGILMNNYSNIFLVIIYS